jgi:SAM-dependent methyltransferase
LSVSLAKDIAKNALVARTPLGAWRERRYLKAGYEPEKDDASYVDSVFRKHKTAVEAVRPVEDAAVLEIGPGGNTLVAERFLRAGARSATCIDHLPLAEPTEAVEYRVETLEDTHLPDGAFDIAYSHAVMEHVQDPQRCVRQIARLLRPGGVTSHQIDLRDHRNMDRPLDFLRYSDRLWRLATSHRQYTNRWRISDFAAAFAAVGLTIVEARVTERTDVPEAQRSSFDAQFATKPLDDLSVIGVLLVAAKPPLLVP